MSIGAIAQTYVNFRAHCNKDGYTDINYIQSSQVNMVIHATCQRKKKGRGAVRIDNTLD